MKATIEFNFPDELDHYEKCMRGPEYYAMIDDLRQAFRSKQKHADPNTTWQEVWDLFWEKIEGLD